VQPASTHDDMPTDLAASFAAIVHRKSLEAELYAA
jgi:hypothetical protein